MVDASQNRNLSKTSLLTYKAVVMYLIS